MGYLHGAAPDRTDADCVLSGEPSGIGAIGFASKGFMALAVTVRTRGATVGYSHESRSAIEVAADVIRALKQLESMRVDIPQEMDALLNDSAWASSYAAVRSEAELDQLRRITVDVCTIKGGSLPAVIPSDCRFTVSIVFPQGTDVDSLARRINDISEQHDGVSLRIDGVDMPDMSDRNGELPAIIQAAAERIGIQKPLLTPDIRFPIADTGDTRAFPPIGLARAATTAARPTRASWSTIC